MFNMELVCLLVIASFCDVIIPRVDSGDVITRTRDSSLHNLLALNNGRSHVLSCLSSLFHYSNYTTKIYYAKYTWEQIYINFETINDGDLGPCTCKQASKFSTELCTLICHTMRVGLVL